MTRASAACAGELVREGLGRGAELREQVAQGTAVGTFLIELPHPRAVRALALAGLDFVVVDMEHSGCDGDGTYLTVGSPFSFSSTPTAGAYRPAPRSGQHTAAFHDRTLWTD